MILRRGSENLKTEFWKSLNQNKKKRKISIKRSEDHLRNLGDNIKHTNIHIIWIPEEGREKRAENIFEDIIYVNSLNLRN